MTIKIIILLFLVGGAVYAFNQLDLLKKRTNSLTVQKTELKEANEYLEQSLDREKNENDAKGQKVNLLLRELAGLQDTKRIKEEFATNQEKLRNVNNEYNKVKGETSNLKQENINLNNRLKKLTNEFTETLETVRSLQAQVNEAKSDKIVRKLENKLKKTEAVLKKREKELKVLKEENRRFSSESKGADKEKRIIENNVMRLEKENVRLETLVDKIRIDFNEQQRIETKLKDAISGLKANFKTSETDKLKLAQQIDKLNSQKETLEKKFDFQNERIQELQGELLDVGKKSMQVRKIEREKDDLELELKQAREKMKEQNQMIARLEAAQKGISINEIPLAKSGTTTEIEGDLSKAYALYDTAKAQVVKFSELFMSKEVELETSKKRVAALEEDLKLLRLRPEVLGDEKYAMLNDRIRILNESLLAKDAVMQDREAEVSALKQAKSIAEQRLEYQEKEYKNANTLYSNLKSQLLQSTELLARREGEVIEKNREVLNVKSELILVQAEYKIKEQELKDLRIQQNNTLEDLSRITKLNIDLQQAGERHYSAASSSEDEKQKADKLKRELEELLGK